MISDEEIQKSVSQVIAREILEKLDTSHRDALLERSITEALTSYNFERNISETVGERAREIAAELVREENWSSRIKEAIQKGFEAYLKRLETLTPDMLVSMIHGESEGSYRTRAGRIYDCWKTQEDKGTPSC